jgi:hypothetical protein
MLTVSPLLRRTIAVCVLLIFMSAAVQAGEPFIVTAKEGILSTTTHDDILTLRLYAILPTLDPWNQFQRVQTGKIWSAFWSDQLGLVMSRSQIKGEDSQPVAQ